MVDGSLSASLTEAWLGKSPQVIVALAEAGRGNLMLLFDFFGILPQSEQKKLTDSPIEVKCETVKKLILKLGTEEDQDTHLMHAQRPEHAKTNLKLKLMAI